MGKFILVLFSIIILSNFHLNNSEAKIYVASSRATDSTTAILWGKVVNGLQLGISGDTNVLAMHIRNTGKKSVTILRKILTYENQYDWYHVNLFPEGGSDTIHLSLWEDRDKSVAVPITLNAGEAFEEDVNVKDWGAKPINTEEVRLYSGTYGLSVIYSLNKKEDGGDGVNWFGSIESGHKDFFITK